ncbi:DNA polymerase gamma [Schizosaccharomyces pombe]
MFYKACPSTLTCSKWIHSIIKTKKFLYCRHYSSKSFIDNAPLRINPVGVQYLSPALQNQVFPQQNTQISQLHLDLAKFHLAKHQLLNKETIKLPSFNFRLPPLQGKTISEHFYNIGLEFAEPHLSKAIKFSKIDTPVQPKTWKRQPGWTKYAKDGSISCVPYPDSDCMVFDVEVLYKVSPFAVVATAVSEDAWYCWLSPWLLGKSENDRQLIPSNPKGALFVGHNVSFDRQRIREEYNIKSSRNVFLDTMSLHVATHGMCSRQKPTWFKARKAYIRSQSTETSEDDDSSSSDDDYQNYLKQEPWLAHSSVNSLKDVAKFHCNITLDKSKRDDFASLEKEPILQKLNELITYCAHDTYSTHQVFKKVFPQFLEVCPHPATFSAMLSLGSVFLPVNHSWTRYINGVEEQYQQMIQLVDQKLSQYAEKAKDLINTKDTVLKDPWLRQLDWTPCNLYRKLKKATQEVPVVPKWYKKAYCKTEKRAVITAKSRLAPILLRLKWKKHPLAWSDTYGWVFSVERTSKDEIEMLLDQGLVPCSREEDTKLDYNNYIFFKVPHKDGPEARCGSPLSKSYQRYFEEGILQSDYEVAKKALEMSASCSYWSSARDRIRSQMVVWDKDAELGVPSSVDGFGIILPCIIPMGTVTRRAVENTWLTASNSKKNRLGSELKAMIRAPDGYTFVGADVDSEELWIVALMGDSQFRLHGATALGMMTLEGKKSEGTDLHSKTAAILGVSRDSAKVFNYGRLYGAGLKHTTLLLMQMNPTLKTAEAKELAKKLYASTKGVKSKMSKRLQEMGLPKLTFWSQGTESFVFNKLEAMAQLPSPRTPVLDAGITQALSSKNLSKNSFMTSRVNWAIQSSAVDYLHLLLVSMNHLIKKYYLEARLSLTVHDEVRYLSSDKDKYRVAFALQVANLWTRAFFCQRLGINELPQSVAFFSSVDIDHVLRKDVKMDCVTPSNKVPIPPGEELTIESVLEKLEQSGQSLEPLEQIQCFVDVKATTSAEITEEDKKNIAYLKAQAFY